MRCRWRDDCGVSELWVGEELVWGNGPALGHFGIKLRKQIAEMEIVARLEREEKERRVDPLSMVLTGINIARVLYTTGKDLGLIGNADWVKYVEAGLAVEERLRPIIEHIRGNQVAGAPDFENMTAEQVQSYLAPDEFESLVAEARRRIAAGET